MRLKELLAFLLFTVAAVSAPRAEPVKPLQTCIDAVFESPYGAESGEPFPLEMLCPALASERDLLDTLPLQSPLGENLTPTQLLDLRAALATTRTNTAALLAEPAALGPILAQMDTSSTGPGIWERFTSWLLERLRTDEQAPAWLVEWLESIEFDGETALWVVRILLVAVVLMGLGILLNELMKADLRVRRRHRARRAARSLNRPSEGPLHWHAIGRLPAREQPAALLRYLVDALERAGIIAAQRAWTNREYAAAVRQKLPEPANAFARLAAAAEQTVYGGREPNEQEKDRVRQNAERVRDFLEGKA